MLGPPLAQIVVRGENEAVSSTERYRIVERIGAGGLGVVHKVEDRVSGRQLAMKVMPRDHGVANLRSEFLALARLRHDNIVSVSDYGLTEAGDDFFTMEFVEGPALLEAVTDVPSAQFYQLIIGVLRALAFIHSRGMVHADLKPSNILIDAAKLEEEPNRAARLADFGLAASLSDPDSSVARGTVGYAAPEVYAGRLDARSDLYSFGVIIYEMLTGEKPYTGRSVREVLVKQRRAPPSDPRTLRPELPATLAQLVIALLDPAPGARPQTADEVLASLNFVAGTAYTTVDSLPLVDLSSVLVGRDQELLQLQRAWREALAGQGAAVLVAGEAGMGKSRLLAELKLWVQLEGGLALEAQINARSETPYAGFAKVVQFMLASSGSNVEDMNEWRLTLAPMLGGRVDTSQADHASRFALAEAVTGVVLQQASTQPVLLLLDDIPHAEPATVELISYLIRSVPDAPVLIVLAADDNPSVEASERLEPTRIDPAANLARVREALDDISRGLHIKLEALDPRSVVRLAEQAFNHEIAKCIGLDLYRISGGNPHHATRAMEMMVANGTIGRERANWILKVENPAIPLPADARQSTEQRLSQLPPRSRRILRAASVLGQTFGREVLEQLIDDQTSDEPWLNPKAGLEPALAEAVRARLLVADATSGAFQFAHKRLVNLLYEELGKDERSALHQRAADILYQRSQRQRDVPPGYLARHYMAVGDLENTIKWGQAAAEDHAQSYDHHGALTWYRRLRPLAPATMSATIDDRMGDHYAALGQTDEACRCYQQALDAVDHDSDQRIQLMRKLGELSRRRGDSDVALDILMRALTEARSHRNAAHEAECHLRIGWALMYRADYAAAMEHAVAGQLIGRSLDDRRMNAEFGRLRAAILTYQGETKTALVHLEAAFDDAEATQDDALIAGVLLMIGRAAIHGSDYMRAIDALEKAIDYTERIGHIELAALCYNNLGVACYHQGDWERARLSWERFRRLCDRFDEKSELVNALNNLGILYRECGQFDEALAALDRAAQVAQTVGHTHMAAVVEANRGETLFRLGDLNGAREGYQRTLEEFLRIGAREDIIEGRRRLCELDIAAGKTDEALDRAIDTAREARDAGIRLEEGIVHRVAATALRLEKDYESAAWFIERAREILTNLGARYERAKVDLEAGELAAAQGHTEEAVRQVDNAIDAFAKLGARWDLGRARASKRAISPSQTSATNSSLLGLGLDARQKVGLELFLDFTKALANVEIERLLEIALDKILTLTGYERSFILLFDHDGRPRERMRRIRPGARGFALDEAEVSGTIVERVTSTGQSVAVSDIDQEDELREQESVVALGLRQIMCAPMRAHGRVLGIIYIDSRRLSFEDHGIDLVLLEAFAAQVAQAVENSLLLAEEKRKSELLAVLAHEIRNPLAGILGYSDIGESGEADELGLAHEEVYRRIKSDGERLRRLVDNVLELARHDRGNVEWVMQPFDMATLVRTVIDSSRPAAETREIRLLHDTDALQCHAFGNADRIMQVLSNLLNNALKFTPEEGVITVAARTETVQASDPYAPAILTNEIRAWLPTTSSEEVSQEFIRVDVRDTGPGMSEELRARLFEKFSQGGGRKRSAGVGLGLYISREIIQHHRGSIWVESCIGKGSTFSFRIPVAAGES